MKAADLVAVARVMVLPSLPAFSIKALSHPLPLLFNLSNKGF